MWQHGTVMVRTPRMYAMADDACIHFFLTSPWAQA